MSEIIIDPEQMKKLENSTSDKPFVMLNMLKFTDEKGKKSYAKYGMESEKFVKEIGGEVMYLAKFAEALTSDVEWDVLMLVKYPSRKAFLKMINNPEYIKVHKYREDALEKAVLYSTEEMSFADIFFK